MDVNYDKDCSALEALFQTILSDMKSGYPVLEDFSMKAAKLHTALRTTIVAVGAFLETFQKVADMATNTRGATRDIGAALTRLCIRHKNIDSKLRAFNGAILECLVTPLQEKIEEWKRISGQMDKDHMKEYKKVRADWKKASENTLKLQKKAKKGKAGMNQQLESAVKDYTTKFQAMEESCQNAARLALMEERSRYCVLVSFLKPVLIREVSMIQEIGHLQEIVTSLSQQTSDPSVLPSASEQVVLDTTKGCDAHKSFQTPPSSPSSLGSRKSSMCSISSINSSSSGGSKAHNSPAHHCRPRTVSQQVAVSCLAAVTPRQTSVSSQDSGFTSQDAISTANAAANGNPAAATNIIKSNKTSPACEHQSSHTSDGCHDSLDNDATTPSSENYPSKWTDTARPDIGVYVERPHTISSAYERSHTRPQLMNYTFEPPDAKTPTNNDTCSVPTTPSSQYARPLIGPRRASIRDSMVQEKPPTGPKPRSKAVPLPSVPPTGQAIYANMDDLMSSASNGNVDFSNHPHLRKMSLPTTMPNSLELAEAIRELEANTASLQSSCGPNAHKSIMSLQCSSGYATMTNTPASSDDTIASGDLIPELFNPDLLINNNSINNLNKNNDLDNLRLPLSAQSKYCTLPRNHADMSRAFKQMIMSHNVPSRDQHRTRPYSLSGIPSGPGGLAAMRRGSLPCKPPPPARRSSSHSGPEQNMGGHDEVTYASPHRTPVQHRRANSVSAGECHYYPSTQSEHGTAASSGPARRDVHENIYAMAQISPPKHPPPPPASSSSPAGPTNNLHQDPIYTRSMSTPEQRRHNDYRHPVELRRAISSQPPADPTRTHASVIDTLNQKFAALTRFDRVDSVDELPLPPMPDDLLPPESEELQNPMLSQIREGVQLKNVDSNDRSKPRVS